MIFFEKEEKRACQKSFYLFLPKQNEEMLSDTGPTGFVFLKFSHDSMLESFFRTFNFPTILMILIILKMILYRRQLEKISWYLYHKLMM